MSAEQVIERLIMEYGDAILRMCYLYLKDYHLAEDAAQETFMKAFIRNPVKRHGLQGLQ